MIAHRLFVLALVLTARERSQSSLRVSSRTSRYLSAKDAPIAQRPMVSKLGDVRLRLSRLVEEIHEVSELDLNPIFVLPDA